MNKTNEINHYGASGDSRLLAGDIESVSNALSKDELLQVSSNLGVEVKKSWNKSKLVTEIASTHTEFINQLVNSKCIVKINPQFETELLLLINRSQKLETIFKALSFAS